MPPTMDIYPREVQEAFFVHNLLSDRWDGMSGFYMGKDLSALGTILDTWNIEDKKTCIYFLKHIEHHHQEMMNTKVKARQDAEKRKNKVK